MDVFEIEYEKNPSIDGEKPDFVVPNLVTLMREPIKAVILSIKREVRERWRESVGEAYILRKIHKIPDNIWFITLRCDIEEYAVKTLSELDMRIYIPDECYEQFRHITKAKPLSLLFNNLLQYGKSRAH